MRRDHRMTANISEIIQPNPRPSGVCCVCRVSGQVCPPAQLVIALCGCRNLAEVSTCPSELGWKWVSGFQSRGEVER